MALAGRGLTKSFRDGRFKPYKYGVKEVILHGDPSVGRRPWGARPGGLGVFRPSMTENPSAPARAGKGAGRVERVVSIPLPRLFFPDPDPTERFPEESADIEGYVVAPDHGVTLAATAKTPGGLAMLDCVWAALRRKGVGRRHMTLLNDRGHTVSVMTLHIDSSGEMLRFLRSLLVVPVRAGGGFAEVHLLATPEEIQALQGRIERDAQPLPTPSAVKLPPVKETGALQPEDWAFLGLLSSIGAFDGPEGPTPELVAELLGTDPEAFAEQARAVEHGLEDLVSGLFAPTEPGTTWAGVSP